MKLGAISVKFNWRLSPDEMVYLLDLNDVVCAFYKAEKPEWGEELISHYGDKIPFISLDDVEGRSCLYTLLADQPDLPIEVEVAPDDVAIHMHTSGTTGRPKCVVYSVQGYLAAVLLGIPGWADLSIRFSAFPFCQYRSLSGIGNWREIGAHVSIHCGRICRELGAGKGQCNWSDPDGASGNFG
jgi:acyl-coenzyme A synthetase/AMP-(fatty) acid ligase